MVSGLRLIMWKLGWHPILRKIKNEKEKMLWSNTLNMNVERSWFPMKVLTFKMIIRYKIRIETKGKHEESIDSKKEVDNLKTVNMNYS